MSENAKSFEQWAIVELMGHQVIAGLVSEASRFGTTLMRVDVPEVDGVPGYTKFYGGNAIYAITPVDESLARRAAASMRVKPVSVYILPERQLQPPDADDWDDLDDWDDEG